jgi:hypothetical protein
LDFDARQRFMEARGKASQQDLIARLTGRDDDLIPYEAIAQVLQAHDQIPHRSPQTIPLDRIVGSVGRYRDFTRSYMPREHVRLERWARIDAAVNRMEALPPIDVFQVGEVYFVADGNHRVSVARMNGAKEIEANVTEIAVDVDLQPGDTLDQAIIKAECARFLMETKLGERCGRLGIEFTRPGGFTQLLEHIRVHRHFMHIDHPEMWDISFEDSAEDWYEEVYCPIVNAIERQDLLQRFPGRTEADLYVFVSERIFDLRKQGDESVSLEEVVERLAQETRPTLLRAVLHTLARFAALAGMNAVPVGIETDQAHMPLTVGPLATLSVEEAKPSSSDATIASAV